MDDDIRRDIEVAAQILKEAGATEVYVFGSAAEGKVRPDSDIDLATRGIPPEVFFHTLGKILCVLTRPVDLVDLDDSKDFADFLAREGRLRRVG